ncbi:DUF2993 domain-containing protein [Coleofasciculus sp. H7-2]|uniref:LmeA family phospholipid-binding protein n=1 Tax=Coleofasciculus sp. H7-2 TaxID=3351545 RepID=UPI00366FF758
MTTNKDASLGQQALNKAAEIGLSSQLDEVEELEVDVQTDPLKVVQGQLDSVTIEGEGLVMNKDLRMEEMKMEMTGISINPLSAAFGKIELTKPTDASTRVVLTEADINRAFNSEFVGSKLQNMQVPVNGQPMTIDTKKVDFRLPGENKVALSANVLLGETGETKQIAFTAVPRIGANGQKVNLEDVEYTEGKELSPELTAALLEKASELLNLSNFDLQGMSLRIKQLNLESGKMTLLAEARVEQIPSG